MRKKKKRYDKELLLNCLEKDGAELIEIVGDKLNRDSIIHFKCSCGIEYSKGIYCIVNNGGAFCSECTKINTKTKRAETNLERHGVEHTWQNEKVKEKINKSRIESGNMSYGEDFLKEVLEKDGAKLVETVGNKFYGTDTIIKFRCNCGNIGEKTMHNLRYKKSGALCNECTETNRKNKSKNTSIINFGMEIPQQSQEVKKKAELTHIQKFGEHYSKTEKAKNKKIETCMKNFGVKFPQQSEIVRNKTEKSCIEKYNVRNPTQYKDFFEKAQENSYLNKEYKLPSGKITKVQGFENLCIDILLTIYKEEDLVLQTKNIPKIQYIDNKIKVRKYFPDIYIPKKNLIIEVKSEYTFKKEKELNLLKRRYTLLSGYNYEIWIFGQNKQLLEII